AYQKIEASILSIYEYFFLIFAAFWGWILWSQTLGIFEWAGILLITLAGIIISKIRLSETEKIKNN
ncbi:MAG: EamA family transporter, partial [Alphaproteobacteria bacterium]|nr:EamA family transporter [Alphaproteobacteria bacterium]